MTRGLRYLSLFSGMEAAAVALEPRGWTCVGVAEVDRDACAVLAHRMGASAPRYLPDGASLTPNPWDRKRYARIAWGDRIPNLGDVSQVTDRDVADLGHLDVVIGGSPCQDLSVAGKRAGLGGARSSLFHEQLRIFDAARTFCGARWLVWENVPGAFSSHAGRDFACVAGALAGVDLLPPARWGYEGVALGPRGFVEWCVLDAQWFGVAQRRRRVFAVLDTGSWSGRPPVLLEPDSLRGDSAPVRSAAEDVAGCLTGGARERGGFSNDGIPAVSGTLSAQGRAAGSASVQEARAGLLIAAASPDGAKLATLKASSGKSGNNGMTLLAFDSKAATPAAFGDLSPTLRSMSHAGSHANAGGQVAVAFSENQRAEVVESEVVRSLVSGGGGKPGQGYPATRIGMTVRRLTPRECERLQGVEDDRTLVPIGRKMMADGPRYKMVGNSFAMPCIAWIGERLETAHWWQA